MEGAEMSTARRHSTALVVWGAIVGLLALLALASGGAAIWADATQRDEHGYVSTNTHRYASPTRAIATNGVTIGSEVPGWLVGKVRLEASSTKPLFIGVGRKSDVDAYLRTTSYAQATKLDLDPFKVTYVPHRGGAAPGRPAIQSFWAASATGSGTQALTWKIKSGEWSIVVMNADGSPGVSANVSAGAKIPWVLWAGIGLAVFGALLAALAARMIYRGSGPRATPAQAAATVV
jgi:hypothetical protein